MNPKVSVIIPNYNYSQYLGEAVESALNQTYENIEVVVVDDGSTDGSIEVLRTFGGKIVIVEQANAGVSAARNKGVALSSGDLLAFMDADDAWHSSKIERQVERFLADPESGLIHVGVQDIDAHGESLAEHLNGMEGDVANELLLFERDVILGGGSGIMVSSKVFDEVGGFDTRLSTSADWDFFYRVSSRYRAAFVPEMLLKYRIHSLNMHGNVQRMEREMTMGYEKAFDREDDAALHGLKSRAYGNLYRVLAGSYFHAGDYGGFLRNAVKSIWTRPGNLRYFLEFPVRRFSRNSDTDA